MVNFWTRWCLKTVFSGIFYNLFTYIKTQKLSALKKWCARGEEVLLLITGTSNLFEIKMSSYISMVQKVLVSSFFSPLSL